MSFLVLLNELIKQNSQFIIATYSPILLSFPQATILEMSDLGIKAVRFEESSAFCWDL